MNMDIEGKAWEYQEDIEARVRNLGKGKYGRVLKMARKPSWEEYKKIIQITGIGLIILGAAGFAIMWIMTYLPRYF
jgi:protein transport protein SEC61 subunit gamma-like protein